MSRGLPTLPKVTGEDAARFLAEQKRIDELKPGDPEFEQRKKFFKHCKKVFDEVRYVD